MLIHIVNVENIKIKTKCWPLSKCFLLNWFIKNVSAVTLLFFLRRRLLRNLFVLNCVWLHNLLFYSPTVSCTDVFICLPASCARAFVPHALSPKPMCLIVALGKPYFSALAMHGGAGRHAPVHIPRAQNDTLILLPLNWRAVWNICQKQEWNEAAAYAKLVRNIVVDVNFSG